MTLPMLPDHARQTIKAIDQRLAELEAETNKLHIARDAVLRVSQTSENPENFQLTRPTVDLSDCPLTIEEMVILRDRHKIIRAIAERRPDRRAHVGKAAQWLFGAGIVHTVPVNLAKALGRRMRNDPDNWVDEGDRWFRLRDDREGERI